MPDTTQNTIQEINRLVDAGYNRLRSELVRTEDTISACDHWLQAWELVKSLLTPKIRNYADFDAAYPAVETPLVNWLSDLEMHLHNAGIDDPRYFEERLRCAREQITLFPGIDDNAKVNTHRAEGEALWLLGRQVEAETVYQALIEQLPDKGWGYIGWSDHYYLMWRDQPKDYPRAEAILLQALERPNLDDRRSVIERLIDLYKSWGKDEKIPPLEQEYDLLLAAEKKQLEVEQQRLRAEIKRLKQESEILEKLNQYHAEQQQAQRPPTPGRNDPCWCGSGKKYKHCHLKSDRSA